MIEKFSDEELKQIKKELGVPTSSMKYTVCAKEMLDLSKLWSDRYPRSGYLDKFIYQIIDMTLCNFRNGSPKFFSGVVPEEMEIEYRKMFQEILEIIKKHNRKWEGSNEYANPLGDDIN